MGFDDQSVMEHPACNFDIEKVCWLIHSHETHHYSPNYNSRVSLTKAFQHLNLSNCGHLIDFCSNFFAQDKELFTHSLQVACLVDRIGPEVLPGEKEVQQSVLAAILHDVGKTLIPAEVLNKPGGLTTGERDILKAHTWQGSDLLLKIDQDCLALAAQAALLHHERYDGSGYPYGITKEDIPLAIRLISICDAYSALRSQRVYKTSFSHAKSVSILREENSCPQNYKFDPDLLSFCLDRFAFVDKTH